jgi:hypothetical protein
MKVTIISTGGGARTEILDDKLNKALLTSLVKKKGYGKISRII